MKNTKSITITCEKYVGNQSIVKHIQELINSSFKDAFIAVIVHGSIATDEVIPYSDFDGLLIVKEKYRDSKLIKRFINKSTKLIYNFDPLQHHGWFIIYKKQLQNYPQTFFPHELFEYSKVIYPRKDLSLTIQLPDNINYNKPFLELSNSLINKIENNYIPKNIYQLKSFLSQIMILPTLYFESVEKKGIYKKDSFRKLAHEFNRDEIEILEEISKIRNTWNYNLNHFHKILFGFQSKAFRKIATSIISTNLPTSFVKISNENFNYNMIKLIKSMMTKLSI